MHYLIFLFLQDLCQLTNGDNPYWLQGVKTMTRTFGLELMESILRHYPKAFLDVSHFLTSYFHGTISIKEATFFNLLPLLNVNRMYINVTTWTIHGIFRQLEILVRSFVHFLKLLFSRSLNSFKNNYWTNIFSLLASWVQFPSQGAGVSTDHQTIFSQHQVQARGSHDPHCGWKTCLLCFCQIASHRLNTYKAVLYFTCK